MNANLNDAIEKVLKEYDDVSGDIGTSIAWLRDQYEYALEAEKENSKEFEEFFKEWCDSAEAQHTFIEPVSMHDTLELFFALGRDRRETPIVMTCNGMESAVYQYPAESAKVYMLDYESIEGCALCEKDLNGESCCPHCGFDNNLMPDDAWEWIKARESVVSNG